MMVMKCTPRQEYDNALGEMDDPEDDSTNMDFATGNKLFTMTKREEYDMLIEALSESSEDHFESIMECMRAALIDESSSFDREIGAMVREQLTAYLRPIITTDKIEYDQRMHDDLIDSQAYQADQKVTRMKEARAFEAHQELRLAA